ncbi:hypothetical protein M758_5G038900 [Ceratodon purpureus]|nr:hypothetical protein M758_5G038900 [Ceratodon purpureus]
MKLDCFTVVLFLCTIFGYIEAALVRKEVTSCVNERLTGSTFAWCSGQELWKLWSQVKQDQMPTSACGYALMVIWISMKGSFAKRISTFPIARSATAFLNLMLSSLVITFRNREWICACP